MITCHYKILKENFVVNGKINLDSNTDFGAISGFRDVLNCLFNCSCRKKGTCRGYIFEEATKVCSWLRNATTGDEPITNATGWNILGKFYTRNQLYLAE